MTHGFWEFHNEIHADHIPGSVRDGEWVEFSNWGLPLGFCPEAEVTGRDILPYVPGHLRLPVVSGHKFQSFPPPRVPSYAGIMTEGHNLPAKVKGVWNISLSTEIEDSFSEGPLS